MEEQLDFLKERYELVMERIGQIKEEHILPKEWDDYFVSLATFLELAVKYDEFPNVEGVWTSKDEENAYLSPEYCTSLFGEAYGTLLSVLIAEMYSVLGLVKSMHHEEMLIRPELFVEIYSVCICEWQESGRLPEYETLKTILYWYVSDYSDITLERQFKEKATIQSDKVSGILQDEEWLKNSFLWDKALAKRRREIKETFVARYG